MSLLIKAAIGAGIVLLMAFISKSKNYYIAGLVPLFPTFALIAHYIVFSDNSSFELKQTALFGMLSLIPYLAYLMGVYFLADKIEFYQTIMLSVAFWTVCAFGIFVFWNKYIV